MSDDPEVIRRNIEATRTELSSDVDALADKVTPSKIVDRQADKVKDAVGGVKDRIFGSASNAKNRVMGTAHDAKHSAGSGLHDATSGAKDALGNAASAVGNAPRAAADAAQGNPWPSASSRSASAGWPPP
ncbi:DUF3618 domain-containing protein [Naasia aerilata]|uniref:DUF3618 domain-containing protein n=1 Tax=Naasia aerilata TaxID=1162966 RepID=A0ABN6XSW1_9MICO|nr:DUF3618 domain-containing protein [Naasia aerilata]BDZ46710.1 hypothetical protein GCM10025866_26190 [Naasia aerilata]